MNFLTLTAANMRFKPLSAIFNVLLLAMGIATIVTLFHLNTQIENRFTKDLGGIDLVVSGKGSPLQIILSNVFHLDIPTGNIPLAEAEKLKANPLIKQTIPLALGDNYNGYRIVGTDTDYIEHYGGKVSQGRIFADTMEVVLGSDVAKRFNLSLGDKIVGAHGLTNSDDLHSDFPYTVVGILAPSDTVLDRLVLTTVDSVWHVHEHPDADNPEEIAYKKTHPGKELTGLLIRYATPFAAVQLPRLINKNNQMQAASPAFEMARLTNMMGTGGDILSAFGVLLIGFAAFGFFVTQYNAVNERKYEIALMRSLGATKGKIFRFVIGEVMTLGVCGLVLGIGLAHVFLYITALWIKAAKHVSLHAVGFDATEMKICAIALLISFVAGVLPALKASRLNIVKTLVQG